MNLNVESNKTFTHSHGHTLTHKNTHSHTHLYYITYITKTQPATNIHSINLLNRREAIDRVASNHIVDCFET